MLNHFRLKAILAAIVIAIVAIAAHSFLVQLQSFGDRLNERNSVSTQVTR